MNGRDVVLAREIRSANGVLVLRDPMGLPLWENDRPIQMDPERQKAFFQLCEVVNFCLCTCFSKPQRIVLSYRKDRLRRVSSRKALACGRFPDRAESGMRPWAVCDDCGERQIRPDKPGAALGSHRDGFR